MMETKERVKNVGKLAGMALLGYATSASALYLGYKSGDLRFTVGGGFGLGISNLPAYEAVKETKELVSDYLQSRKQNLG